jgi:membrane protein
MSARNNPAHDRLGARATSVRQIPVAGWRSVLKRTWAQVQADNVLLIAAGVAFYVLLALVPALTAFFAVASLLASPNAIRDLLAEVSAILPESTTLLFTEQLERIILTTRSDSSLTLNAVVGFVLALWASGAGVRAMMRAVTVAYREGEKRSLLRFYATAIGLTLAAILIGVCAIIAFIAIPLAVSVLPFSGRNEMLLTVLRWPVIIAAVILGLSLTYRFGPSRRQAKAKWITTGAIVATLLWLSGSIAFTTYVENVADYEAVHGTMYSIVVLLLWLWFSAAVTIFGAELNAELEHQTAVDTTVGRERPMGERGAYVADHVAGAPLEQGTSEQARPGD